MHHKRKIGILTGGGDTQPLNAVVFLLRNLLRRSGIDFIGFTRGWQGVLSGSFVDLHAVPDYGRVGGTYLRSSRVNLASGEGFEKANRNLADLGIDCLVVIGGDDTLSNVYGIESVPCIAVAKTIDNDAGSLSVRRGRIRARNYFTLGYPTAAEKIARFVSPEEGVRTTAYSHERVVVVESMGMQAGWLAAASAFGKPDLILIPEFPLVYGRFLERLKSAYSKNRHAVVVVAEGVRFFDGRALASKTAETDAFGNPRFGGAAEALAGRLKADLVDFMDARNVNAVNPAYWYRSGAPNALDRLAAGRIAGRCHRLVSGRLPRKHRFVCLDRAGGKFEAGDCAFDEFPRTSGGRFPKRFVDPSFYDPEMHTMTDLWTEYLKPIVSFRSKRDIY